MPSLALTPASPLVLHSVLCPSCISPVHRWDYKHILIASDSQDPNTIPSTPLLVVCVCVTWASLEFMGKRVFPGAGRIAQCLGELAVPSFGEPALSSQQPDL